MSSPTDGPPAGPPELDTETIYMVNTICVYMAGHAKSSFWDTPNKAVISFLSSFLMSNPLATDQEIMDTMGYSEDSYMNLVAGMGGPFNESVPMLEAMTMAIPSPLSTNAVLPVFGVFVVLSTIVMALRLWSRLSIVGRIQSFDYVAIASWFIIVGWSCLGVWERAANGKWASLCDRSFRQAKDSTMAFWFGMMFYPIAILSVKLALLAFYHQLSTWRPLRWAVYVTAFISIGNALGALFSWTFQANKVDMWNHSVAFDNRGIIDLPVMLYATGGINIVTDVMIWLIPMPLVWKLQLYPRERILAIFTFGLGAIACVASIVRLFAVRDYVYYTSGNPTPITVWSMVECHVALICSSAPALRALVIKYTPKLLSRTGYASGSGKSEGSAHSGSVTGEKRDVTSESREVPSRTDSYNQV